MSEEQDAKRKQEGDILEVNKSKRQKLPTFAEKVKDELSDIFDNEAIVDELMVFLQCPDCGDVQMCLECGLCDDWVQCPREFRSEFSRSDAEFCERCDKPFCDACYVPQVRDSIRAECQVCKDNSACGDCVEVSDFAWVHCSSENHWTCYDCLLHCDNPEDYHDCERRCCPGCSFMDE